LLVLLVDATEPFGKGDQFTLEMIKQTQTPALLWFNKVDALKNKAELFPLIECYSSQHNFKEIIPGSALTGEQTDVLIEKIFEYLPSGPMYYPETEITDQPERVLAAEIVREKLLMVTREEIPYETAVYTERFLDEGGLLRIHCVILVERESQKGIIIGRGGQRLKQMGTLAREELEFLFGKKIYLDLFVKVRQHWREDPHLLDQLGIER
jgi:GTP-binding protein Era